jgi:Protein of unknown function (DUF1592)/Protein of unknown function (DUF1588)/Protein of unknown function (DUF1595)/Protein of unknown function (DUF1587)/Protein of unknown function (DUF1585)
LVLWSRKLLTPDTLRAARSGASGVGSTPLLSTGSCLAAVLGISAALCGLSACEGEISGGVTSSGPADGANSPLGGRTPEQVLASDMCRAPSPGRAPLRRLSNSEYRNTLADLLGDTPANEAMIAAATQSFPSETESLGFRNNADYLNVSTLVAQGYMDAAEQFLDPIATNPALLTCTPIAGAEVDCAKTFITSFGKRVFRRPLSDAEVTQYAAIFLGSLATYDFPTAIRGAAFALLQSPNFLYRVELGAPAAGAAYTQPSGYEMANRLSYLFWQSMPDQALFDAADSGQLSTPDQIKVQAQRLLADPKASRLLDYFDQWLGTDTLNTAFVRDAALYPNLDPNLVPLLQRETRAFVSDVLSRPDGSLTDLFTAPYTFANAELAAHYGLSGPSGTDFVRIDTPGRAGVLTQGMLLARDKATRTSIVRRGLKIRLDVLCQTVDAPPPNVNVNLDTSDMSGLSQRQRLEQHRQSPSCSGCHDLMDPIGVVFEGFDAVGRARTVDEQGRPIDTTSSLANTEDTNGPMNNPSDLGRLLAKSEEVKACYVTKSFRFFYGRDVETPDVCSMAQLLKSFKGNAYSLSELLVALTQTDAFLYRSLQAPEAP